MAGFPATPAFVTDSSVREYDEGAAQTFLRGACVVLTAQLVVEAGVDPASILGFAASAAGKQPQSLKSVGAAALQRDLVHICWEGQRFWISPLSGQTLVYADTLVSYGITKDTDGIWKLDRTKVAATRLNVQYVDLDRNLALVSVLAANRQIAP